MRALGIAASAIGLGAAASVFAAGYTSPTTVGVTTAIIRPISVTGNVNLSFGAIVRSGTGSGTVGVTTANVASVTGAGVILLPSTAMSAANFTVSGKDARAFTLVIDRRVTLTNKASSGGTLTVTTVDDAGCTTSCSIPSTLSDLANGAKIVNVAGSFPFTPTTHAGAYAGDLNIGLIYN